jgi:hypothetical protein
MAGTFSFGGVRTTTTKKDAKRDRFDHILKEVCVDQDSPMYLILVDFIPEQEILDLLYADLAKSGLINYVVASAITTKHPIESDASKGISEGKLDMNFILQNESSWRTLLKKYEIEAVLTMGGALYCAQRSTDTLPQHYLDDSWHEPRCFLSEEFVRGGDLFYYPSFGLIDCYPIGECGLDNYVNYRTRFFKAQVERMITDDHDPEASIDMRPYEIEVVDTKDRATQVLKSMMDSEIFAHDTETSGFNSWLGTLGCVTFSNDGVKGYYVPWNLVNTRLFSKVIETAKVNVMVNAKFDFKWYWLNGVSKRCQVTDDAMLLAHAIDSSRSKGLKPNAIFETRFGGYDDELDRAKRELKIESYLDIPVDILSRYATLDAIVTWRLFVKLLANCRRIDRLFPNEKNPDHSIEWWYSKNMMPTYRDMIEHEFEGMYVDEWELERYRAKIDVEIDVQAEELRRLWNAPRDLDLKSTKTLGNFIENTLRWPIAHRSKDGSAATNDDALLDWEVRGMPGIKVLKQFRSLQMGKNMFLGYRDAKNCSGWEQYILRHADGTLRFHTNFNAFGTETFRHKGKDPNTQQFPSRGLLSKYVEPVLTCPTTITYTLHTDGDPYVGVGNRILRVIRGRYEMKVTYSMVRPGDAVLEDEGELWSADNVIQEGSIGDLMVREYIERSDLSDDLGESRVVTEVTKEKGPEEYYLVTADVASAQNREAGIDQILNQKGIDDVMYQLYGSPSDEHPDYGSLFGDMHSVTAYETFVRTVNAEVIEIHDDSTGKDWLCYQGSELWVKRQGQKDNLRIYVEDLKDTDEIIDYEYTRDK